MEDEEKPSILKDNDTKSSDAASTIKRWDNHWTPSEIYDSSGTTSASEPGEDYSEISHRLRYDILEHHNQVRNSCKSQSCLCQSCLLDYAKMIALQKSLPNVSMAANGSHLTSASTCNLPCCSFPNELAPHPSKERTCSGLSDSHRSCNCYLAQHIQKYNHKVFDSTPSTEIETSAKIANVSGQNNRYVGSLDRRKKRLRNKIDRNHRTKSHSDLICCGQTVTSHYPLPQHFCCGNSFYANNYCNTEERLRKLENERTGLHMEISVLSEQLDVQSNKIIELENALQEKQDSLRHLEETLQKEVLSRSALETQKLELLSSLSEMKLRQASLEHENMALRNSGYLTNGERFSRHAGHYSSLPRPPTSTKKGVIFGKIPNTSASHSTDSLAEKGVSERCLSAPTLADEEKSIIPDSTTYFKSAPSKSFDQLSMHEIGEWLTNLGLESYTSELKRWGATGNKLLLTSNTQLEKELDIKNILHRKKLLYAIESEKCSAAGFLGSDKMDNAAVLRWLDDIGLPQHKEAFLNAKVDGRVLHRLTTEDLLTLNVTAQLHAASLRRGIQVLRELNFEFDNLERRSSNENNVDMTNSAVCLWTNHRVMEWLRIVDLAEYAPNMRGSGVHGGLMVYEPRFTSELLATLLSIPPAKTLLRRHLTTHFNQIVGREVVQQKREMENTLGFTPLTLTARLKIPKKTQFTLKRKKSKNEVDFGNLVCPLEESPPGTPPSPSTNSGSPNLNSPTF